MLKAITFPVPIKLDFRDILIFGTEFSMHISLPSRHDGVVLNQAFGSHISILELLADTRDGLLVASRGPRFRAGPCHAARINLIATFKRKGTSCLIHILFSTTTTVSCLYSTALP